jgi:hypothetical protein
MKHSFTATHVIITMWIHWQTLNKETGAGSWCSIQRNTGCPKFKVGKFIDEQTRKIQIIPIILNVRGRNRSIESFEQGNSMVKIPEKSK